MANNQNGEEQKDILPTQTPEETEKETSSDVTEDAEFAKELENLESGSTPKPTKSELEKATFSIKSTMKRIKELGGNPAEILADEIPATAERTSAPTDTSQFVTKADLAYAEAQKIAKSQGELNVIMWWVNNKGMSVSDAHFMANKNRISKLVGEVTRTKTTTTSVGGGSGERPKDRVDVPQLSSQEKLAMQQAGMVYNSAKKAYIGKKIQHRFDEATKVWVTEKL